MSTFEDIENVLSKIAHLHPECDGNFIDMMRTVYDNEEGMLGIIRFLNAWQTAEYNNKRIHPNHKCWKVFCKCPTVAYDVARCVLDITHRVSKCY